MTYILLNFMLCVLKKYLFKKQLNFNEFLKNLKTTFYWFECKSLRYLFENFILYIKRLNYSLISI